MILLVILTLVIAATLFIGSGFAIRALARIPFYWVFTPANTFCLVVSDEDESGDGMTGVGNLVNVLHAVPGKRLNKNALDTMEWQFEDGEDPEHDRFSFRKLGVQSMGNIFYTTRFNVDKRMRFAREKKLKEEEEKGEVRAVSTEMPHTVTKINRTRNVFYSGELSVSIKEADTADKLGLDMEIDFSFRRKYPVKSVLRLADASAFLTSLVEQIVNNETVVRPAEDYIGDKNTKTNREDLALFIASNQTFHDEIEKEVGFAIVKVSLRDVKMKKEHRDLLELQVTADKKAQAKIRDAEGDRDAQKARNEGDADRIIRVIIPAARDERTVAVRTAEAYENNKTVTTFAPGSDKMLPLGK